ncbi:unnamed protein product [Rotaria sp. Silwood2]|nr:unnamed protein product [Rotaria sp. Silwood2]CAF4362322.1 unnamed protein product [Rotaria sp. Silwood2]
METYTKLIGETYLCETLTRFVTDIVSLKNSNDINLEVDSDRREYSIVHSTVADLFEQIDLNTHQTLNELTNIKFCDSTIQNDTQIHLHHNSISTSSTITTVENLNKEDIHIPFSFKKKNIYRFVDSLCIESLKSSSPSSSEQSLVHLTNQQSLQQQPLFVLNNGYMTRSTQNLTSSNINTSITTKNFSTSTTYCCVKTNDEFSGTTKRQ